LFTAKFNHFVITEASFHPILMLIPWFFQKLFEGLKKVKVEVDQLHFEVASQLHQNMDVFSK
jgi:hypothetical protein